MTTETNQQTRPAQPTLEPLATWRRTSPIKSTAAQHRRAALVSPRAYPAFIIVMIVLMAFIASAAVAVGSVGLPLDMVWKVVLQHFGLSQDGITPAADRIVWELRLPRVLLGLLVGAGLSVAGTTLQAAIRNPLSDPYILGVSQGASLGAVTVMVLGSSVLGGLGIAGAAFLGAGLSTALVFLVGRRSGRISPIRLILGGVAIGNLFFAATSFLQMRADPSNLSQIVFWLLGSLVGADWSQLLIPTVIILVTGIWLTLQGRHLNALVVGDESASALGVNVNAFRIQLLVVACLLTATVVAVAGGIGIVGLMIPHLTRLIVGPDHRRVLPAAVLIGGTYMVLVDLLGRFLGAPSELPLGIFTAAIGTPFFLMLMIRSRRIAGGA